MRSTTLILSSLLVGLCWGLTQIEADGLVACGVCTSITITNDCTWLDSCTAGKVICLSGRLTYVSYKPSANHGSRFREIISNFVNYFENVTAIRINDTELSPPVPWTLSPTLKDLKLTTDIRIYSKTGGLHGTLPTAFTSPNLRTLIIDGGVEGVIPSGFLDNSNICEIQITNHKLFGTLPASVITNSLCRVWLNSAQGNIVGPVPNAVNTIISSTFAIGQGYNGGMFCDCSANFNVDNVTGLNACYNYLDSTQLTNGCHSAPTLSGCSNPKLTMRYGVLCYDVCQVGCPTGTGCGIEFSEQIPTFACLPISVAMPTSSTIQTNDDSGNSPKTLSISLVLFVLSQ